jgi:hypothetical protein
MEQKKTVSFDLTTKIAIVVTILIFILIITGGH